MSRKRTGVDNESGTLEKRQRLMPRREKGQSLSDHGKCPESPKSEASTSEKLRYDSMELFAKEGYEDVSNVLKGINSLSKDAKLDIKLFYLKNARCFLYRIYLFCSKDCKLSDLFFCETSSLINNSCFLIYLNIIVNDLLKMIK